MLTYLHGPVDNEDSFEQLGRLFHVQNLKWVIFRAMKIHYLFKADTNTKGIYDHFWDAILEELSEKRRNFVLTSSFFKDAQEDNREEGLVECKGVAEDSEQLEGAVGGMMEVVSQETHAAEETGDKSMMAMKEEAREKEEKQYNKLPRCGQLWEQFPYSPEELKKAALE